MCAYLVEIDMKYSRLDNVSCDCPPACEQTVYDTAVYDCKFHFYDPDRRVAGRRSSIWRPCPSCRLRPPVHSWTHSVHKCYRKSLKSKLPTTPAKTTRAYSANFLKVSQTATAMHRGIW